MDGPVFEPAEVIAMHACEGRRLANVLYYFWLNTFDEDRPFRFLYFLELILEDGHSLLLTSGEDSSAIRVSTAEELVKTAADLRDLHGKVTILRSKALVLEIWQTVVGHNLEAIRLTKNGKDGYLADAIVLDFGDDRQLLVSLDSTGDGLVVGHFEE